MSDKTDQEESEPQFFSQFVKDSALKILIDYQRDTGRKWQKIRTEIINVTGAEVTEHAPIITRQDLESWSNRKSVLGDEKFKWVYRFLTHPTTLARPEFSKANDLLNFGLIKRIGVAFHDFFAGREMPRFIRRTPSEPMPDIETIEQRMNGFEGIFVGSDMGNEHCLSLRRFKNSNFFICHYFSWPTIKAGEASDWNIDRYSGFCTIGGMIRLHTKSIINQEAYDMYIVPKNFLDTPSLETFELVLASKILHEAQFKHRISSHLDKLEEGINIETTIHRTLLKKTNTSKLTELIDQFQWNIIL